MATGFTDFSEYTTGVKPSDWTYRYSASSGAEVVTGVSGDTGGKVLRFNPGNSTTTLYGLSWDVLDDLSDVELVIRYQLIGTGQKFFHLGARMAGSSLSNADYYSGTVIRIASSEQRRLYKRVSGSPTTISSTNETISSGVWRWVRLRCNGTTIQTKHWLDSESEPGSWTYSVTDSSLSASGWAGLIHGAITTVVVENDAYVDIFGYGTGGDTAPTTGTVTEPTLSAPVGTATGATTATVGATTDRESGTLYVSVTTSATPPSSSDIKAGTGAAFADDQAITSAGAKTFDATGLTDGVTYYAHLIHNNSAGDSNIVTSSGFTPTSDTTTKLRIDELLYTDKAKTALVNITEMEAYVLDPSDNTLSKYFADVDIVDGVVEITDALYDTPTDVFEVVLIKGDIRGVFPATVIDD
jgi:hypothetical protein